MSEYATFQLGAFVSPLTAATTNSLLEDADPALFAVLAFYKAILATHLGARFDAETAKAGLPGLAGGVSALAIPYDPLPFLTQAQLAPPLLALYVATERPHEKTRNWYHLEEHWKLVWVLPPLSPAQYLQLYPFLRAVTKVLVDRTELGYDPAHQSGALVFGAAGIEEIRLEEARYGTLQGAKAELFFPTVEIDLTVYERKMATPGLSDFGGLDGTVSSTDPAAPNSLSSTTPGANPLPVIDFQEDLP